MLMQLNHGSIRQSGNRKATEKISRKDNPGSSNCQLDEVDSEPMVIEVLKDAYKFWLIGYLQEQLKAVFSCLN